VRKVICGAEKAGGFPLKTSSAGLRHAATLAETKRLHTELQNLLREAKEIRDALKQTDAALEQVLEESQSRQRAL
jgi:type II secretory pathway component PulM